MGIKRMINGCTVTNLTPAERADFHEPRKYHVKYPYAEIDEHGCTGRYVNSLKEARELSKETRLKTKDKSLIEFGWGK